VLTQLDTVSAKNKSHLKQAVTRHLVLLKKFASIFYYQCAWFRYHIAQLGTDNVNL